MIFKISYFELNERMNGRNVFSSEELDLLGHVSDGTGYIQCFNDRIDSWEYLFRWKDYFYVKSEDGQYYCFRIDDKDEIRTGYIMALKGSIHYSDYLEIIEKIEENEGECIQFGDQIAYYKNGNYYRDESNLNIDDLILYVLTYEDVEVRYMLQSEIEKYL